MSGLFKKLWTPKSEPAKIAGLQLMTSEQGVPIPIVYGTMRIPGHLICYDSFRTITGKSGKHAGLSGSGVTTEDTYTVLVMIALCEGPITTSPISPNYLLDWMWADKDVIPGDIIGALWSEFTGSHSQSAWGFTSATHPSSSNLPYSGTAYIAASALDLGGVASLKNISVQVQGFLCSGPADLSGYQDAAPDQIIVDFLSNAYYGAGWDSARIADLTIGQSGTTASGYHRYCLAAGMYMSPVIDGQKPAATYLQELLDATNSAAVFSGGLLKVIPYGDQAITGNSVTFTPYVTPQYDLDADTILPPSPGQDMIAVTRAPLADTFNCFPVEYMARQGLVAVPYVQYNQAIIQDVDPLDADRYGVRQGPTLAFHGITQPSHALQISRIAAQRSVYIRNTYTFRLPYRYILLEPMDLVRLTDAKAGLSLHTVRIKSAEEDDQGGITIVAEEWPFGVGTATLYDVSTNDGTQPNTNADPGDASAPALFDMPALFGALGVPTVGIATAGGDDWGGAQVWTSWDNVTYELAGMITAKATYGVLTGTYASGTGFDTTHTLPVDLSISEQPLVSVSDQQAQDLEQPAMVGSELVSFATATLTGTDTYNITRVQRAAYGTTAASHAAGQDFILLDDAVFRLPVPLSRLGTTLYVKLVSVNQYGGGLQDITTLSPSTHTVGGSDPPYPASVTLTLATTRPTPASTTVRAKLFELQGNVKVDDSSTTSPVMESPRYATVTWGAVSVNPAALLTGFEVVIYTGSDPNAVSVYQVPKGLVPSSALGYQVTLPSGGDLTGTTLVAAVRPVYGTFAGPWRTSTGQTVGTVTYPLNVPITFTITQTASTRTTVTFTVKLTDPYAQITGATTLIVFAGLTALTLNGSAAGASYFATYGTADTFVATLNPAFNGAGYVRIGAVISGRSDSYGLLTFQEKDQDAAPTLALSVKSDGTPVAVLTGNDNTASWIYKGSTSAMPSDADVTLATSTGTTANGQNLSLNPVSGFTLAIGDRFYFKARPYDAASAGGLAGTIVSGIIDYQNDAPLVTTILTADDFFPIDDAQQYVRTYAGVSPNGAPATAVLQASLLRLPIGTVLSYGRMRCYRTSSASSVSIYLYKINSTGGNTLLQTWISAADGWTTVNGALSETVDNSRYMVLADLYQDGFFGDAILMKMELDHTPPNYTVK